jgi:hypothetical protein
MRGLLSLTLVAIAATFFVAQPQQNQKKGKKAKADRGDIKAKAPPLPAAKFAGVIPAAAFSDPGKQSDWPAIAYTSDGSLWSAFVEWNDKNTDRMLVRRRLPNGQWQAPVVLDDGSPDHYAPAIAAAGDGVIVVWPAQVDGNFELFVSEVTAAGASKPERLTRAAHGDINVRAAADPKGNVTIAWQSFRNGNADIYARRRTGRRWGREVLVSSSKASDWQPALALDSRGAAWISWDSYQHGNYDVFLRSLDAAGKLGSTAAITTEPSAQFHTGIAIDREDRVWVAWDDGGDNWGKDFSTSSAAPGSRGLHWKRSLGIRAFSNGRIQEPSAKPDVHFTGRMTRYAELPHLALDGNGSLVMVFRHWTGTQPAEIFDFYAVRLEGNAWSEPYKLDNSSGQNSQTASLAANPQGGVTVAYVSDGRSPSVRPKEQMHSLHYVAYASEWPRGMQPAKPELTEVMLPPSQQAPPRRPRHTMKAGGTAYSLILGDSHRHTDIRGHSGVDGSILDTYRYAIDAAQLDWLGVSDHNEVTGGNWPDSLRDYQWFWTQKAVDLFTHSPVFTGVYSYEHSMSRPGGHRNVLFLKRGAPLRPINREKGLNSPDNSPPEMWKFWEQNVLSQPGQKSVIVPHTFAAGPLADWNWPNARFDCLLEIYQGARGSYEFWRAPQGEKRGGTQTDEPGHFARDALAKGNVYGFVSFSDHASTHNSWAAVWVRSQDRKGLLDGLYERRTYAGTDEIILRVTGSGHMPGEEWSQPSSQPLRIQGTIDAPDTILRIDVVKDGKYIHTAQPNARKATIDFRDSGVQPGKSYYYVRVFQRDTEKPDGDPEIAWVSPFYLTYR